MGKNISIEVREFLPRIESDILQRFPIASFFLLAMLILRIFLEISFPDILFYLVSLILLISIPVSLFFEKFREKKPEISVFSYFIFLLFDLILLTVIIYFLGGITWIIPAIYLFYIITAFWIFPAHLAIIFTFYASLLLIFLTIFQNTGILSQPQIFLAKEKNPQNFPYLLTTTIGVLAILGFLGYSADNFYQLLTKKIKELKETQKRLTLTREFLKEEVAERTAQLEREKERLEKEVRDKTRELQERKNALEFKVLELEKFYKIAVSRELEIAKLKEEITKLKELQK